MILAQTYGNMKILNSRMNVVVRLNKHKNKFIFIDKKSKRVKLFMWQWKGNHDL